MNAPRILVAGIGNIFHGDDAFGVEVIWRLSGGPMSSKAHIVDFGIRSFDLAFALIDGYDVTILVDAVRQGGSPGTLYLIEPDLENLDDPNGQPAEMDAHSMNPVRVLQMAKRMGARFGQILILGCEPETFGPEGEGQMSLTPIVEQAVEPAAARIRELISEVLTREPVNVTACAI